MDPQQRLLLEVGYTSLHSTGQRMKTLHDKDMGIFLGIMNADFLTMAKGTAGVYAATGGTLSIAAGRLSFVLGTQGPVTSIDTACSSALVALDGASLSLRPGYLALTLAVSLMLTGQTHEAFASAGMLSVDGRCKTFDARANGYARGEGVSTIVLSLLGTGGLPTAPLLQNSEVCSDGKSASLTAPSGAAQARMMSASLTAADVKLVGLVQAHGTGTALGDPIEAAALSRVLGTTSPMLGSIKSALGHSEPVAGLAGLILLESSLAVKRSAASGQLRSLNARLSPPFLSMKARVPTQGGYLKASGSMAGGACSVSLTGCVSSFG